MLRRGLLERTTLSPLLVVAKKNGILRTSTCTNRTVSRVEAKEVTGFEPLPSCQKDNNRQFAFCVYPEKRQDMQSEEAMSRTGKQGDVITTLVLKITPIDQVRETGDGEQTIGIKKVAKPPYFYDERETAWIYRNEAHLSHQLGAELFELTPREYTGQCSSQYILTN